MEMTPGVFWILLVGGALGWVNFVLAVREWRRQHKATIVTLSAGPTLRIEGLPQAEAKALAARIDTLIQ